MPLRGLGTTGQRVSVLGLGTVKLGRTEGVKYPVPARMPTEDEARALLDEAARLGVNVLDTAPAYGRSEERLGALLAAGAGGARERWVIVTKAGEEFEGGVSRFDFSPGALRASCERSLQRLRTDRVDVLLVHSDGVSEAGFGALGVFDMLDELKREGKVVATGVSTKTAEGAREAIARTDVVMLTVNRGYTADLEWVEAARVAGKGVLVKKALASGHTPEPAAAVAYAAGVAGVSCVVVGTTNVGHLRGLVRAV
jgi:aryl-alcohol dehydrogenase-like predicted oxidoreductase